LGQDSNAFSPLVVLHLSILSNVGSLLQIAAISILIPQLQDWERHGGRGTGSVLFFDLNCKFDMQFMLQILRQEVKSLSEKYNLLCQQEDILITRALEQLKVIPCPSSFHFLAALNKVERHSLTNAPTLNAYIMVDDLSAHFQVDRVGYGFNTSNSNIKSTSEQKLSSYQNTKVVYASIMRKLTNLQRMLEAPIILTSRAGTELQSSRASGKTHSQPWHEEVTHSFQVLPANIKDDGAIEGELDIVVQWLKPFDPNFERLRLLK
jgi:hypothetical protein